jgi:hypothetical protein
MASVMFNSPHCQWFTMERGMWLWLLKSVRAQVWRAHICVMMADKLKATYNAGRILTLVARGHRTLILWADTGHQVATTDMQATHPIPSPCSPNWHEYRHSWMSTRLYNLSHFRGRSRNIKRGGPAEFYSKRGGPTTYSGQFVLEIKRIFSKRGVSGPPGPPAHPIKGLQTPLVKRACNCMRISHNYKSSVLDFDRNIMMNGSCMPSSPWESISPWLNYLLWSTPPALIDIHEYCHSWHFIHVCQKFLLYLSTIPRTS